MTAKYFEKKTHTLFKKLMEKNTFVEIEKNDGQSSEIDFEDWRNSKRS